MTAYRCRFVSCIRAGYYVAVKTYAGARMTVRDKQPLEQMLAGCATCFAGADAAVAAALAIGRR